LWAGGQGIPGAARLTEHRTAAATSPREAVEFLVHLRLGGMDLQRCVDNTLARLGLTHLQDKLIGGHGCQPGGSFPQGGSNMDMG
jgi:hypothetical protein